MLRIAKPRRGGSKIHPYYTPIGGPIWFCTYVTAFLVIALAMSGCVEERLPLEQLFPASVGAYLRTEGPGYDAETGANFAYYEGPEGRVFLRTRQVGAGQVEHALGQLPLGAANVAADPALGVRDGTFFEFGGEYHAAGGNGDWVFVISASSPQARAAFLALYGF